MTLADAPKRLAAIASTMLVAAAAGLSACGAPLSEQELSQQAAEICTQARERFAELQHSAPRTAAEAEVLLAALIETAEDEGRDLDSLRPPAELESAYEEYLEAREEGIELLREGADAAAGHDADAYERARRELDRGQDARKRLARAAGLEGCAERIDPR